MTILRLRVLDRPIGVDVTDEDYPRIADQWSACLDHSDEPLVETVHRVSDGEEDRYDYSLASAITVAGITTRTGELTMLHACGVADLDTGRTAVLVAASGTGKTTAARTLAANGFGYVTDETLAFDDDGVITAYPKPLSVVIDPAVPNHKSQHSPDELGLARAPQLCTVSFFGLLERSTEPVAASIEPVDLIDALVAIIPQSSALPTMPRPLRRLAAHIVRTGGARRVRYSEIADTLDLIAHELDSAGQQQDFEAFGPVGDQIPRDHHAPPIQIEHVDWNGEPVVRAPYTDAIGVDGEIVVLTGGQVVRLFGVAAIAWACADTPAALPELLDRASSAYGEHADAEAMVREGVCRLVEAGLLRYA